MSQDLLDHYRQLCIELQVDQKQDVIVALQQIQQTVAAETSIPVTTLIAEIEFFSKKQKILQQSNSQADIDQRERVGLILSQLLNIQDQSKNILQKYEEILRSIDLLRQIQPQYTRIDLLLERALPLEFAHHLPLMLDIEISNKPIHKVQTQNIELLFQDESFLVHCKSNMVLQDMRERIQIFIQIQESIVSMKKCIKSPLILQFKFRENSFQNSRMEFDEQVKLMSESMIVDEQKTAKFIEQMIEELTFENANIIIPTVLSLKGAIKRPRISKFLQKLDKKIYSVISKVFDNVEDNLIGVSQFCSTIGGKTGDQIIQEMLKLKMLKADTQQSYTAGQLFIEAEQFKQIQGQVKLIVEKIKQKEAEIFRFSKQYVSQLFSKIKIQQLIWFNKQGQLEIFDTTEIKNLIRVATGLQNLGYDYKQQALTNEIIATIETFIGLQASMGQFAWVSQFYNSLTNLVKNYQKPLLIKSAQIYEQELKKCSDSTQMQISSNQIKDAVYIQKIIKIADYAEKITDQFEARISVLDEFHQKQMLQLSKLKDIPLSRQQQWIDIISEMREEFDSFLQKIPIEMHDPMLFYWSGGLCKLMASKYTSAMKKDLAQLRSLNKPIIVRQDMSLDPTPFNIQSMLLVQVQQISKLPLNNQFHLSDKEYIKQMFGEMIEISVDLLPEAIENVMKVTNNLFKLQEYFVTNCSIIAINLTNDVDEMILKLKNYNNCLMLYQHSENMSEISNVEAQIRKDLPFLVEKNDEKNVYIVQPSGGSVSIDLQTVVRLFGMKKQAGLDVAMKAASHLGVKLADQVGKEILNYKQNLNQNLQQAKSSEQFKKLAENLSKMQQQVKEQLSEKYDELEKYLSLLKKNPDGFGESINKIQTVFQSFQAFNAELNDVNQKLESKKQDMFQQFKLQLVGEKGIIGQIIQLSAKLRQQIDEVIQYLDLAIVIKPIATDDQNKFFKNCFNGNSVIKKSSLEIENNLKSIENVQNLLLQVEQEIQILFQKNYIEFLQPQHLVTFQSAMASIKFCQLIFQAYNKFQDLETLIQKFSKFEFAVLKQNTAIFEEITVIVQQCTNLQRNDQDCTDMQEDDKQTFKQYNSVLKKFITFINKLFVQSNIIIKQLKSNSLTKYYWVELSEKLNLVSIIKYFASSSISVSQIPEYLNGIAILYLVAQNLFSNPSNIISDQLSIEYKKFVNIVKEITTKAENEMVIRSAIEEISYWLKTDAKISFNLCSLSQVSQDEIRQQKIKSIPLIAHWKQFLTSLTEKKAVINSVIMNPFAKSLKQEIDDASQQIEALTRMAHIIGQIGKQIVVLEPVMGRKVLPNEHQKFYQSVRLIAYSMCSQVPKEQLGVLQQDMGTIIINVADLIKSEIPEQLKVNPSTRVSMNVDNTALGNYKKLVILFENASSQLADVQIALRQYLEVKRLAFPRFYFLADQDVLEILANANNKPQQILQPHIKKLFSAVEKLEITSVQDFFYIQKIISSEGEIIQLKCPIQIKPDIAPELWLNRLDLSIKDTIKTECCELLGIKGSIDYHDVNKMSLTDDFNINQSYNTVKSKLNTYEDNNQFYKLNEISLNNEIDYNKYSGEVIAIAIAIQLAAEIDDVIDNDEKLKQILLKQTQKLQILTQKLFSPEISTATFGSSQFVMQLKLKSLATDMTHYIQVLSAMISDKLNRKWIWNREMKAKLHKSHDVYYIGLDTFLPYTFEYQGLYQKLIHTPLTTRCFSTLISALNTFNSSNPQGPAGTGKTESVKAFSCKLARPCIVFNCDSAIDRDDLGRILIGIVLSGSVGCFDEVNRLSPAVLSAVSTDIENIQKAIQKRQVTENYKTLTDKLTLGDISIPISNVSPFAAVFVTMNPASREYRGRSELPFSLLKLLRGCFMGKADVSQIMETVLATSGFQFAQNWAEKSELTYQLASRRIPKEVHLDWGLRSLQSVLRQAALQRAGIVRKAKFVNSELIMQMEKQVIIKALSDATLSRIQNQSVIIFNEILKDVFGKTELNIKSKCGAANDIEIKLVQNMNNEQLGNMVLQFYRALTSKLGVCLLGKTASGKTTIRKMLKQAVEEASEGKIVIQEFLISPKSMNRSDLLGYVDPVTKEWNDGALTKAARQAVMLISQQSPTVWPIIVFDGDVDPNWIEALNSSLDDNRLLSLSSGERIRFPMSIDPIEAIMSGSKMIPTPISFVFETDSLQHASPATVSRLAVILVPDRNEQQQIETLLIDHPQIANIISSLSEEAKQKLAEVTTHMIICSQTEKELVPNALRALASEIQLNEDTIRNLSKKMGFEIDPNLYQITPDTCESNDQPKQQQWAIRLIQSFLQANQSIIVAGQAQSSKFFCILQASSFKDQFQLVEISCTSLTTREDIIRTLINQCVEYQRVDGMKELKPKSGKKLIITLRNVDIGRCDEYNHSEIYTLLWGLVAHKRLYSKGLQIELKNINFAITVNDANSVPTRLRRLMGVVRIKQLEKLDIEKILGQFNKIYQPYQNLKNYQTWLQNIVQQHESMKIKAKSIQNSQIIAIPQIMSIISQPNFIDVVKISKQNINSEQLAIIFTYLLETQNPFQKGKEIIQNEIKQICKIDTDNNFLTYQKAGYTVQIIQKFLQNQEPITQQPSKFEMVSLKVRINMIKELLNVVQEFYPGARLFNQIINSIQQNQQQQICKLISAVEFQLINKSGMIVLTQPNNYSFESVLVASFNTLHEIHQTGCDSLSSSAIKNISERIASGVTRLVLTLDTSIIEHDSQWIAFASAIASKDVEYIKSKLTLTDMRYLISKYQEKNDVGDQSENEIIQQFLIKVVQCVKPILILNPESNCTDNVLSMSPPIRREFGIVSFPIITDEPELLTPTLKLLTKSNDPNISKQIIELSKKFKAQYLIPEQQITYATYLKQFILKTLFKEKWFHDIQVKQDKLKSGLDQLSAAQREVDQLSQEASKREQLVQKAQEECNIALKEITLKMEKVQANKLSATQLEKELKLKEGDIFVEKEKAESELAQVKPLLDEAKTAVSNIPNDAMSEVRSFKAPPPAVEIVLGAVAMFMGFNDISWSGIKSFLSQNGILSRICSLNINDVPQQIQQRVQQHVSRNAQSFEQSNIQRVSKAAAPLARWVKANLAYTEIFLKIEPLMKKCEEANKNLVDLRLNLKKCNDEVGQLERDAEQLKLNFNKKTQDLHKYKKELEQIDIRKQKGLTMLHQLSGEKIRWTENNIIACKLLEQLDSCAQQASSMFVLTGNQTDDMRDGFIGQIRQQFGTLLYSPTISDQLMKQGLRISQQSLENAALLEYIFNTRSLNNVVLSNVTDATGVIQYLRNKYNPQFASASQENLTNLISIAARFGQMIVVTDCDQGKIPAPLLPYLRYGFENYQMLETSSVSNDEQFGLLNPETTLKVAITSEKLAEMASGFKLIIVSSVKIFVPSHLQARLVELSFAPTNKSRVDLYMDKVLNEWSPETLTNINELNLIQADLRLQLSQIEDVLLQALKESKQSKNLLEDQQLITALDKAYKQNEQIQITVQQTLKTEEKLKELKQKAIEIANVVQKCVQALECIMNVNELYIIDDSAVIPILDSVLKEFKQLQSDQVKINSEMVEKTKSKFIKLMYQRIQNMVFTDDKIGALAIFYKTIYPEIFSDKVYQYFTGQVFETQMICPSWAAQYKRQLEQVMEILGQQVIESIRFESAQSWGGFVNKMQNLKEINIQLLPECASSLNQLQKSMIISAIRPDLLSSLLQQASDEQFGGAFPVSPIEQALQLSSSITQPIIIYTSAGQDPTGTLDAQIVALAPGKEQQGDILIENLLKTDTTKVVIKGAHLCYNWLSIFPSKLQEYAIKFPTKQLKFILLLEPKLGFPKGLSRISWRICLQQSISPRSTMLSIIRDLPEIQNSNFFYAVMFVLGSLHTTLESRRIFQPRGVSNDPGWNSQDCVTLGQIFQKLGHQPQTFIDRVKGYCIDVIYGVQTKDISDLLLVKNLVDLAFHKDFVKVLVQASEKPMKQCQTIQQNFQNMTFSSEYISICDQFPVLKYFIPPLDSLVQSPDKIKQSFVQYVTLNFQDKPSPDQLGLHSNSLLTKSEKDSLQLKQILLRSVSIQQTMDVADLYSKSLSLQQQFSTKTPKYQQILKEIKPQQVQKTKTLQEELLQQLQLVTQLLKTIQKDFTELQFASENALMAPESIKLMAKLINSNTMPEHWAKGFLAPPVSIAPVSNPEWATLSNGAISDFFDLLEKTIEEIARILKNCSEAEQTFKPIFVNIALLPNPGAFMEAVRRYEGSCKGVELDQVKLYAQLSDKTTSSYPSIILQGLVVESAEIGININFGVNTSNLKQVTIVGEVPTGIQIPFYIEKQREVRMPVVDAVVVEGNDPLKSIGVSVYGVYIHLNGR